MPIINSMLTGVSQWQFRTYPCMLKDEFENGRKRLSFKGLEMDSALYVREMSLDVNLCAGSNRKFSPD